jgi:uncharacterized protein (TIGR00266 family)
MEYTIEGAPEYAWVKIKIPRDQTLKVEASAMAAMDSHLSLKTRLKGGFSRFLSGDSLFLNEFTAKGAPGEIQIAPGPSGDIKHFALDGSKIIFLQNAAFLASTVGVQIESKWQGLSKGLFGGQSLFMMKCTGQGDLWFNSFGAIFEVEVDGEYVVDSGYIVAFTEGLQFNLTTLSGFKSFLFSGEGFVCRFQGRGKIWVQTRHLGAFAAWVHPFRPVKDKS